jgi:hypothetical protein
MYRLYLKDLFVFTLQDFCVCKPVPCCVIVADKILTQALTVFERQVRIFALGYFFFYRNHFFCLLHYVGGYFLHLGCGDTKSDQTKENQIHWPFKTAVNVSQSDPTQTARTAVLWHILPAWSFSKRVRSPHLHLGLMLTFCATVAMCDHSSASRADIKLKTYFPKLGIAFQSVTMYSSDTE